MDARADEDWKKTVGFPINYSSDSTDDDFDCKDVVFRNPRQSAALLADSGDGMEADMLGTTPPRSRIRKKEKLRRFDPPVAQRMPRRDVVDHASLQEQNTPVLSGPDRQLLRKRSSMKQIRTWQRDSKQDLEIDVRCDSLPNSSQLPAVPTLVDTCSRFMSLTSRPKHPEPSRARPPERAGGEQWGCADDERPPDSRVSFHQTFSLLINMGNIDKGCKRAISREEQVWQNELKDLIWLELQAKLAGRELAQQDAYLCAQRTVLTPLIARVLDYRFVNPNPCRRWKQNCDTSSREDLTSDHPGGDHEQINEDGEQSGCLSFECQECCDAVGRCLREVGALLEAFYNAGALYPSSRTMTADHPLTAGPLFKNRIKAMCLWYNTAVHMRMKMLAMLRMLRSIKLKEQRRQATHRTSLDSDISRQSSEGSRVCQVRFNISQHPSDSSNSEGSALSETARDADDARDRADELDSGIDTASTGRCVETPEIVVSDTYGAQEPCDTGEAGEAGEAGGASEAGASCDSGYASCAEPGALPPDALAELAQIRLLNKCDVSLYRDYHREILKTQGVRRCMAFISKMRTHLLDKVYLTLVKPDSAQSEYYAEEEPTEVFDDPKDESEKQELEHDEDELRRYGCWSMESVAMRLPSYRAHFLLLSAVCMEAVHDYLCFRLDSAPDKPSCLTVKQLIHELREGLDISSEMRADFVRHARAALPARRGPPARAAPVLRPLLDAYDATVQRLLQQYLSYLTTMSETESMPRACLQAEWAFTARLAGRIQCAAALAPLAFSTITCNQLNRLLKQFDEEFGKLLDDDEKVDPNKEAIYAICRSVQNIYACSRDTALQAAQWARALAARLARAPPPAYVQQRGEMFDCIMAIRDFIVKHIILVLDKSKSSITDELTRELNDTLALRVRELLLQIYKLGFEIHKELHRFVNDIPSVRGPLRRSAASPPARRAGLNRTDSILEDYENNVFDEKLFDNAQSIDQLLGERAAPEAAVELRRAGARAASCAERQWAARVARAVIGFARCWMKFVVERCDRGRGLRPRWASQGLEFLMLACDPCNTKHLSEEEFEELKQLMDGCISHVVGSRPAPRSPPHSPRPRPRLPSPFPSNTSREPPPPPTPPAEPAEPAEPGDTPLSYPEAESIAHRERVVRAIRRVDLARDTRLRAAKSVGTVLHAAVASYEPKLRQLTFKWQRGLKIGAGTFGKVYTVVNTESGQLLAMKELAIGAGDRRALQRAANELRVLEGVIHPHLVRYYGCELHREEMLLFMELCVEGSLEALVATAGALAEPTARRYTKQLLSAVAELHARNIAHRDIKSGNIFLTNEGHCLKLGDFGCAVKIRANTTAPGELQGFVGTQAYMAPEVFMKSSGHGRAADIWSLGCVVTEMASGKRPFPEYDSNYQIMFVVGMGGRPDVPEGLSAEGRAFCLACLTHDADARPRATDLLHHHFLMVKSDEDCKCEPAYLIT